MAVGMAFCRFLEVLWSAANEFREQAEALDTLIVNDSSPQIGTQKAEVPINWKHLETKGIQKGTGKCRSLGNGRRPEMEGPRPI